MTTALTLDGVVKAAIDLTRTERVNTFVWFEVGGRPVWSEHHPGWFTDKGTPLCKIFPQFDGKQPVLQMMRSY